MPKPNIYESSAIFSPNKIYRYSLTRTWDAGMPRVCFIMLNPSAADESQDDPTIRRCIRFSAGWGYGSMEVVNLFAYRTQDPRFLKKAAEPIGPKNDWHISDAVSRACITVVGWGVYGHQHERARSVLSRLTNPHCLALTKHGAPKHPLYVHGRTVPIPYAVKL